MDTIFFNGCIRTLDDSEKVAEAVGIENGRIVFVGTDKEAEAFSCKKRIDLKGRLMLPWFCGYTYAYVALCICGKICETV